MKTTGTSFPLRLSSAFLIVLFFLLGELPSVGQDSVRAWIRVNQLGYTPIEVKMAVLAIAEGGSDHTPEHFQVIDAVSHLPLLDGPIGRDYGSYGPFKETYRLDLSKLSRSGTYYIQCGHVISPTFRIAHDIYQGSADFALRYMRQQRSGFNPFLRDSCHTRDGYTVYGPMPDNTHLDVSGGWHDATDYLQYVTTSANATYHLLSAYRDYPDAFTDSHLANGLPGSNGTADVLDEARWGLEWLRKMNPQKGWMFNQLADDRDHAGYRLPTQDSVDYGNGRGNGRTVYFASGDPQGLGKYKNRSTGVASTAGKFASAFALAAEVYYISEPQLSSLFRQKAVDAYQMGLDKPGVCQTAPNREPYFYEEDNWVDDMELAAADLFPLTGNKDYLSDAIRFSNQEKVTPWMGADTARHYQWYPFHNFGHFELAGHSDPAEKQLLTGYYKEGIERVWKKARENGFYRGIPFIWCSNNLTVSFAIQCALYRKLSGDTQFASLEQACIDWLFGCNPWGKCMVYGLPENGDTPKHPHSSLSHLYHYPLDGGLVDGPLFGSIYKRMRGLRLELPDNYAAFQSDLVVYHDDGGDYSTNEPTMDGTASLVYLLAEKQHEALNDAAGVGSGDAIVRLRDDFVWSHGAIIRGDTAVKKIALVFTGDEFADGGRAIARTLEHERIKASFFLTGNFYRASRFKPLIEKLRDQGHYLASHSDKHLLYCDWNKRDSLLVSRQEFSADLNNAYGVLQEFGIDRSKAPFFLPPYEWYNDSIARWTKDLGLQLVNFTPGTRSNADYTYPAMGPRYADSKRILESILRYEKASPSGLNGFILLSHISTDPRRKDKFYDHLGPLIDVLKSRGYQFVRIDDLLDH